MIYDPIPVAGRGEESASGSREVTGWYLADLDIRVFGC
jgi:hypothetical protein